MRPEASREERLDSAEESGRWFALLFGVFLIGGGVVLLVVEVKDEWARWVSLMMFVPGALLLWLGVRMKRSFYTEEGVLRSGWTGVDVVPWGRVDTIELEEVPNRYENIGWVRLRLEGGKKIAIRTKPEDLDAVADRIAGECPQAFRDDRRTGEVTAPVGADPALTREREVRIRARAARAQRILGRVWIGVGVFCGLVAVACVAAAVAMASLRAIVGTVMMGIGCFVCVHAGRVKLLLARITELGGEREGQ